MANITLLFIKLLLSLLTFHSALNHLKVTRYFAMFCNVLKRIFTQNAVHLIRIGYAKLSACNKKKKYLEKKTLK